MPSARRLFIVPPSEIIEYTLDTVDPSEIPLGPIEEWDCYAVNWDRGPNEVLGPFTAVIEADDSSNRRLFYIRAGKTQYWYHNEENRPQWYQSGSTLRFIRKRK